jgi:hypothetical protein
MMEVERDTATETFLSERVAHTLNRPHNPPQTLQIQNNFIANAPPHDQVMNQI